MNKIIQSMVVDNDTLVITDPCYLLRDEEWDKFGNKPYYYDKGQQFLSTLNFGECIMADTGYGDWSNEITDSDNNILGNFCADAGMVCVLTLSDLSNYGYDIKKFKDYLDRGLITVIPDFTGTVGLYYEETEYGKWAVLTGAGDFEWSSIKHE